MFEVLFPEPLFDDRGDAGRHHYLREFSEAVNARRLGDLLQRVSTPGGGR